MRFEPLLKIKESINRRNKLNTNPTSKRLIISGFFDLMTPAMQSVEIARRMKNASHYCDPFSSHCTTLESPEWCLAQVVQFLNHSKVVVKMEDENVKKNR